MHDEARRIVRFIAAEQNDANRYRIVGTYEGLGRIGKRTALGMYADEEAIYEQLKATYSDEAVITRLCNHDECGLPAVSEFAAGSDGSVPVEHPWEDTMRRYFMEFSNGAVHNVTATQWTQELEDAAPSDRIYDGHTPDGQGVLNPRVRS